MPLDTGNVETLFEICSKTVANHAAESYDKMTASHDKEDSSVVNPYNKLPLLLLEKVVGYLTTNNLLNARHRDLLINTQTRKLDLNLFCSGQQQKMTGQLMQLAVVRCPQLLELTANWCSLTVEHSTEFLPHFKYLQVLNVASQNFDDRCLEILGIHCKDLRELNVRNCHVTDVGIIWLCGGPKELIGKNVSMELNGLCKSLEELIITDTKITRYGAAMALQRLPHLRILAYERMAEAFSLMHPDNHVELANPKFALTQLNFESLSSGGVHFRPLMPYQTRLLRLAISLCPLLTNLDIHIVEGVTDADLLGFKAIERLTLLKVSNVFNKHVTFDGSLAPILRARGRSLKTLDLEGLDLPSYICLALMEFCPNLELLSLLQCEYFSARLDDEDLGTSRASERVKSDFEWKHLKQLKLYSSNRCDITAEFFLLILTPSPALQTLTICDSSTFTDDVLQRVFECNSLNNLETLRLIHCPYVTERGTDLFRKESFDMMIVPVFNEEDYEEDYDREDYYREEYYQYEDQDDEEDGYEFSRWHFE